MKAMPLSIMMENAKAQMTTAINQVLSEYKLPAYLMEGILLELLSETRRRKSIELLADFNAMSREAEEEKENG